MFGFGRKRKAELPEAQSVRPALVEAFEQAIQTILFANLTMMGLMPGQVPITGRSGEGRCRGYLIGVVEGIRAEFAEAAPTREEIAAGYMTAVSVMYGFENWQWALDAIDLWQAHDVSISEGVAMGRADVSTVYGDANCKIYTGFWLFSQGDEVAIQNSLRWYAKFGVEEGE